MKRLGILLVVMLGLFTGITYAGIVEDDVYYSKIRPIFEQRCVACHSCYESPCQLKLTSYEGFMRGAHGSDVYTDRFKVPLKKHRMFKDAKTTKEWRAKGFWPVAETKKGLKDYEYLDKSLLWKFVKLGDEKNIPTKESGFKIRKKRVAKSCVKNPFEFNQMMNVDFKKLKSRNLIQKRWKTESVTTEKIELNEMLGMPYGLPRITPKRINDLKSWIEDGSNGPSIGARLVRERVLNVNKVNEFEGFLNNDHFKNRWTAKYLYEHLYLTHIIFDDAKTEFFELVRSKTRNGNIEEIVTDKPYDAPGVERVYYRLQKIHQTIVLKTHILFRMNDKYLTKLNDLFINVDWKEELTDVNYTSSNPFINFKNIPAKSRYQFMLDNAYMLAGLFTTGSACNGAYATYAVRDHFWILFLDPDSDVSLNTAGYFDGAKDLLSMPHDDNNSHLFYLKYHTDVNSYEEYHAKKLKEFKPNGLSEKDIWNGDDNNRSALLTIYRHDKRTSVHYGTVGGKPRTTWVVDYPVFERIYYNLVAGYDVYSGLRHKLHTRVYMEQLRRESEDMFLIFLPKEYRQNLRKNWYKKRLADYFDVFSTVHRKEFSLSDIEYTNTLTSNSQFENVFMDSVKENYMSTYIKGPIDRINISKHKEKNKIIRENYSRSIIFLESYLSEIANNKAKYNRYFKDVSYLRIDKGSGEYRYFSLVHNVAHQSMNVVFDEEETLDPQNDTIDIVENLALPHPNIFFDISFKQLKYFIKDMKNIKSANDYKVFEEKYAVLRTDERFWDFYDDLNAHFMKLDPITSGIFDLNLYGLDQGK